MSNVLMNKMRELKLHGMLRAFDASRQAGNNLSMTTDEFLDHLIQAEWEHRRNRKIKVLTFMARFRYTASIEDINFTLMRNLDKNLLMRLADGAYLEQKENIIITGPTGVGKSYIASALGHQACSIEHRVAYYNISKLFQKLKMSKADATFAKEMKKLERTDLLILDDFGLQPIDDYNRLVLLEMVEDRHGKKSTIITSQIPVSKWYELLGEQTIADAILDRLVHSSHRIEMAGESIRKKNAKIGNNKN